MIETNEWGRERRMDGGREGGREVERLDLHNMVQGHNYFFLPRGGREIPA